MQEKDGWKRIRASIPDYRIIIKAEEKARKYHKHHGIYVRGAHYEYYFEKVAGQNSIIYRRLKYQERTDKRNKLIKITIILLVLLIIGAGFYLGLIM